MTFIPTLPTSFRSLSDPALRIFLEEVCDNRKLRSFSERTKSGAKFPHGLQTYQDRHYLELVILNVLRRKESNALLRFPDEQLMIDSLFECAEFISVLRDIYRQAPAHRKGYLKGHFNSGFDNPMGMIPFAHEVNVAHGLYKNGFEVELTEYAGVGPYDFSIRKNAFSAQVDCKACGGDNGKFFKVGVTDVVYGRIKNLIKSNEAVFNNKILCLSVCERGNVPKDVPLSVKRSLDGLLNGHTDVSADGIRAELFDFTAPLSEEIKHSDQSGQVICDLILSEIIRKRRDWGLSVEWHFLPPPHLLDVTRFACLFCSPGDVDWRKNAIRVVKDSLSGQLKDSACPVIFLRYSDLSDQDIQRAWFSDSDVQAGRLNPFDALFHDIVSDAVGGRLCGLFFQHRPRFHESPILGPSGRTQTSGRYPIRSYYNRQHPLAEQLQTSLRW